jgi:hypothetical protein
VNLLEDCKPVPQDVTLSIAVDGDNILISWPAEAMDFVLQETDTLSNPQWSPVTETPEEVDGNFVVTQTLGTADKFFRLIK